MLRWLLSSRVPVHRWIRVTAVLAGLAVVAPALARAEVTRIEITSRADLAFAGYEKIVGRVFFAVDPADPRNMIVADIDKAPRNAMGRVEFSSDFELVRPKANGNGVLLVDIVNRGGKTVLPNFNRAGGRDPDVGDGFLLRRGFTVASVGWEFDVPAGRGLIRIEVPVARDVDAPITGIVRASFTPAEPGPFLVGDLAAYAPLDPAGEESLLTVRDQMEGVRETIPRDRWTLTGATVNLQGGFTPGRIYELSFRAANPPVAGLGFIAVRDFATWVKHEPGAITSARYAYAFGNSQSGRFLRTFLYQGFNSDERGRQVLDATLINIAGAARLDLNRRWATPTTASAPATQFPFADTAQVDPVSGLTEGLLDNPRAAQWQPKIFYSNTGVEYWSSSSRAAALTHTTPDGSRDLEFPENVRSYFLAGAQHSPGAFPPVQGLGQQLGNPLDYWWTLRALLVAMDQWVREGVAPPPSQYPRLDQGTLVASTHAAFPAIPGVQSPREIRPAARTFNTLFEGGAGAGTTLPMLVPQVDSDGNELAGIRLPDLAVPLATYTGWNFRKPEIGGTHLVVSLLGSYIPLSRSAREREARRDPRLSIEERYRGREAYLTRVKDASNTLVRDRYLLAEDVDSIMRRTTDHWARLMPSPNGSTASR
ncbi:MAG: hypothetical protein HOP16_01005 [Acidobacteria bacterium]|nr:hypothetical protein [Acidobacteriota bacterium]